MTKRLRFGEWLEDRIRASGMTQVAFAAALDVSQASVSNWINGGTFPNRGNASDIARVLERDIEEIRDRIRADRKLRANVRGGPEGVVTGKKRTPVRLLARVPASRPTWIDVESEHRMIELPEPWLRDVRSPAMAVEVNGDCLTSRGILDGDLVICEPVMDQRDVPQGKVVLVRIEDEYTLKVWFWVGADTAELRDGNNAVIVTLSESVDFEVLGIARKRFGDVI